MTVECLHSEREARGPGPSEQMKWLVYWGIFGLYFLFETCLLALVSVNFVYWLLKTLIFIILYINERERAFDLYSAVIEPFLEARGDSLLEFKEEIMETISYLPETIAKLWSIVAYLISRLFLIR